MRFRHAVQAHAKRYEAHKTRREEASLERAAVCTQRGRGRATTNVVEKKSSRRKRIRGGRARDFSISRSPDARDTRLSLIGRTLAGREKYFGGALGKDGKIYAIPGFARRVLRIDPSTGAVEYVGPDFSNASSRASIGAVPGSGRHLRPAVPPTTPC